MMRWSIFSRLSIAILNFSSPGNTIFVVSRLKAVGAKSIASFRRVWNHCLLKIQRDCLQIRFRYLCRTVMNWYKLPPNSDPTYDRMNPTSISNLRLSCFEPCREVNSKVFYLDTEISYGMRPSNAARNLARWLLCFGSHQWLACSA